MKKRKLLSCDPVRSTSSIRAALSVTDELLAAWEEARPGRPEVLAEIRELYLADMQGLLDYARQGLVLLARAR